METDEVYTRMTLLPMSGVSSVVPIGNSFFGFQPLPRNFLTREGSICFLMLGQAFKPDV